MYIFYICIYLGKSNHKCRPKNLLLYKFLIVQKGVSHLNITIYFRNLHIYNIFQEPAHIQYISGTCTYTIYFRNLHIYNIFQEPANIQYISGTCTYTVSKVSSDICQLRLDFITLVQAVGTNTQVRKRKCITK